MDLPEADSPVNHTVKPRWPRNRFRSCRVSDGCQVILLHRCSVSFPRVLRAYGLQCSETVACPWGRREVG